MGQLQLWSTLLSNDRKISIPLLNEKQFWWSIFTNTIIYIYTRTKSINQLQLWSTLLSNDRKISIPLLNEKQFWWSIFTNITIYTHVQNPLTIYDSHAHVLQHPPRFLGYPSKYWNVSRLTTTHSYSVSKLCQTPRSTASVKATEGMRRIHLRSIELFTI